MFRVAVVAIRKLVKIRKSQRTRRIDERFTKSDGAEITEPSAQRVIAVNKHFQTLREVVDRHPRSVAQIMKGELVAISQ